MEISKLEDEIIEIEKVKERYKPSSSEWNKIEAIITDKKRILNRLKRQEDSEEEECGSCGGWVR